MFHKRSLVYKQVLFFLLVSFSIIFILGIYFYYYSKDAIIKRTYEQLTAVREIKKNQLEFIFNEKVNTAKIIAGSIHTKDIYKNIVCNKNENNDTLKTGTVYDYCGFSNIYVFEKNIKEGSSSIISILHYDTNGQSDPVLFNALNKMWNAAGPSNYVLFSDYVLRFKNDITPVILIALPFEVEENDSEKMIVFEVSYGSISDRLLKYSAEKGFGYSGEAYVVGSDYLMRSDSRFIKNAILNVKVQSDASKNAISGQKGEIRTKDYRGIEVYSSYSPLNIWGMKWAVLSEIDCEEATKSIASMRNDIIFLTLIIALFVVSISVFLALRIVNPIRKLEKAAQKIGRGDFNVFLQNNSKDEIGSLTSSFNQMTNKLNTITSELKEREQRLNHFYEATLEGILIHDKGKPVLMNQALLNITGYDETDVRSLNISDWLNSFSSDEKTFETLLLKKSGEKVYVEVRNNKILYNNSVVNVTVLRDITSRKQAELALSEERKERLTALFNGQEIERQRISRELHDGLGQQLAGIKLKLENLSVVEDDNKLLIYSIKESLASSIEELRRISYNLRPPVLTELGLAASLKNLCAQFEADSGIECEFSSFGTFDNISVKTSTYFYRICQESLNNILKHAESKNVNLQLIENKENYIVIIEDNGKGFVYSKNIFSKGNGLYNMHERVMLLGGTITVESVINKGTTLRVKVPRYNKL